ncbi:MAG: hypothetical protein P4M15_00125 [Alphaproteobacteria bacterium]|nr:hypothetical protein [Alphaproteobacteria bacterium]
MTASSGMRAGLHHRRPVGKQAALRFEKSRQLGARIRVFGESGKMILPHIASLDRKRVEFSEIGLLGRHAAS